jgi:3-deoxy-D-manno-octulosonate 8-phosphate phosphatase (KDO 8-P phosphatase)
VLPGSDASLAAEKAADAAEDVRRNADLVTQKAGGKGCVREVIEAVMKHQGKWYASDSFIW